MNSIQIARFMISEIVLQYYDLNIISTIEPVMEKKITFKSCKDQIIWRNGQNNQNLYQETQQNKA